MNFCAKQVKRAGRGFTNFDHYRLRVLLNAGGVTWPTTIRPPRIGSSLPTETGPFHGITPDLSLSQSLQKALHTRMSQQPSCLPSPIGIKRSITRDLFTAVDMDILGSVHRSLVSGNRVVAKQHVR